MHGSRSMRSAVAAAGALALFLVAATATAEPPPCSEWFPDFNCERSGRFEGFQKPIVAPYLFEDPFIVTGLYPYYVYHDFPGRSAMQGGDASVAAVQARLAVTDRFSIFANKDGFVWKRPGNPLLDDTQGFLNLAGGIKYAFAQDRDAESPWIVSGILRFEAPTGSTDTYQGYGDGMVLPSIAGAWGHGDLHLVGDFGAQVPFDTNQQSTSLFWHVYADYTVAERFQPFVQFSGLHWVESGDGDIPIQLKGGGELSLDTVQQALGTGAFEGADVMNLGSRNVNGLDLVTAALGAHVPITEHVTFSFAYERPISHHKGIFQQRVTTSVALEF